MPISTSWYDDDHRVIILQFEGNWGWDELQSAQEEQNRLAATVSHNLIALVDMSHTRILPQGNILSQGRSSINKLPDNLTQMIVIIQSRMIEVFAGLVFDMIPSWRNRVQFAKTPEEGQRLVAEAVAVNRVNSGAG
jgi:hypothetical protein